MPGKIREETQYEKGWTRGMLFDRIAALQARVVELKEAHIKMFDEEHAAQEALADSERRVADAERANTRLQNSFDELESEHQDLVHRKKCAVKRGPKGGLSLEQGTPMPIDPTDLIKERDAALSRVAELEALLHEANGCLRSAQRKAPMGLAVVAGELADRVDAAFTAAQEQGEEGGG